MLSRDDTLIFQDCTLENLDAPTPVWQEVLRGSLHMDSAGNHSWEELQRAVTEKVGLDPAGLNYNSGCTVSWYPQTCFPKLCLALPCGLWHWATLTYWWMCYAFCGSRSLLRRNCIHVKSVRMMWLCLSILFKYVCDKAWEPLWSLLNMEAVLQSAVSRNVVC